MDTMNTSTHLILKVLYYSKYIQFNHILIDNDIDNNSLKTM